MAVYRLTRRAEIDLFELAEFTLKTWGQAQCERYLDQLESCLHRVADNPSLGQSREWVRPGLRAIKQGKHVIFYKCFQDHTLVLRILHERMDPTLHLNADEE
ncbi:MAG: type II toxin-antitoxin system RelE/ParE family toxin [Polyangiaceae bacterium]